MSVSLLGTTRLPRTPSGCNKGIIITRLMSRFRFLNITRVFVGGAPEIAHKRTINVSVIASFLSHLFTLILRHGYMPKALRDCLLIPIPKPNKDPSLSDNYRSIGLLLLHQI